MDPIASRPPLRFRKTGSRIPDCCRLPLTLDAARLRDEFRPELWSQGEYKQDKSRCKFFVFGRPEVGSPDEPLPVLAELPATRQVIESLPGNVRRAHFSLLEAGDALPVHTDGPSRLELFDRTLRLHLPIVTNDASFILVNGRFYRMGLGEVWQMNNLLPHSAVNGHARDARIHLIIDLEPDAELLRLANEADPNAGFEDAKAYGKLERAPSRGSRNRPVVRHPLLRSWKKLRRRLRS